MKRSWELSKTWTLGLFIQLWSLAMVRDHGCELGIHFGHGRTSMFVDHGFRHSSWSWPRLNVVCHVNCHNWQWSWPPQRHWDMRESHPDLEVHPAGTTLEQKVASRVRSRQCRSLTWYNRIATCDLVLVQYPSSSNLPMLLWECSRRNCARCHCNQAQVENQIGECDCCQLYPNAKACLQASMEKLLEGVW